MPAGALPQTPLGELTALPQTPWLLSILRGPLRGRREWKGGDGRTRGGGRGERREKGKWGRERKMGEVGE